MRMMMHCINTCNNLFSEKEKEREREREREREGEREREKLVWSSRQYISHWERNISLCLAKSWSFLKTLVPISMGNNIFVLHHNTSTSTNKPDCHYRSCFYCSALQHITVFPQTRGWCHTERLCNSMLDVTVCLQHRHYTLSLACLCLLLLLKLFNWSQ